MSFIEKRKFEMSSIKLSYYAWHAPDGLDRARLVVANSLTGTKPPFAPVSGGNQVTWFISGPTVYDSVHMGHASNYVWFDIVRRILSDYFGYDVVVQTWYAFSRSFKAF